MNLMLLHLPKWSPVGVALIFTTLADGQVAAGTAGPAFEVSLPASAQQQSITGRVLLMLSRKNEPEVRLQVGWINSPPVFGVDVQHLEPGQAAVIGGDIAGYPLRSLSDIPPGDYYVQALLNVYTEFHRADGHVIWAHNDQWEGQRFNRSPGNRYSKVQKLHLDPAESGTIKLSLTEVIPALPVPADTPWIKHIKIQSKLLTAFWGRPMYLGAVVLLPRDYASHPDAFYPVIYKQGHFSQYGPFDFRTDNPAETAQARQEREDLGYETGYEFYRSWSSDHFPRMIVVTLLHPTPYYDDSYAVNSANTGPYGDAIMTELIPYLEQQFRILGEPYARVLTGGSTGGWEALALQVYHPAFFGGAWVFYPDPIDFRRYDLVNIYDDTSAFVDEGRRVSEADRLEWLRPERFIMRGANGQPLITVRDFSQLEAVLGSRSRSGEFLANWQAVYGPVGKDGYPQPLWDTQTGRIDADVARYMRDHGYDLRDYTQKNWPTIGRDLVGKLHFYCGDMDNFYLNLPVYSWKISSRRHTTRITPDCSSTAGR